MSQRAAALVLFASLPTLGLAAPIRVAVVDGGDASGTHDAVQAQLIDDTWYDFEATVVVAETLSAADIGAFDVVVLGTSGRGTDRTVAVNVASAVQTFQAAGGGVVATSWLSYQGAVDTVGPYLPIDQANATSGYCAGPTTITASLTHPVVEGITSFVDTSTYTETPGPALADAEVVATAGCNTAPAVITREGTASRGRQVYLGSLYFGGETDYNNTGLRAGEADRVLEQAVAWASGLCTDEDSDGVDACSGDCDDDDAARFPGNAEICDGIDNDCDDDVPANEADDDDDGFRVCEADCDDGNPARFPGNAEICDGLDNDCNDQEDDGLDFDDWWPDADGDGFGDDDATPTSACAPVDGSVDVAGDCDDSAAGVNPDAEEIPDNGIDEDCDGEDDDGGGCGCQSGPSAGWLWGLLLPALALRRRRG
jgi:MYXO-CTERM domain-containing protein